MSHPLDPLGYLDDDQPVLFGPGGEDEDEDDEDLDDDDDDDDDDYDEDEDGGRYRTVTLPPASAEAPPLQLADLVGLELPDVARLMLEREGVIVERDDIIDAEVTDGPILPGDAARLAAACVEARCRVCGCTDQRACPGGCVWAEPNLCSRCAR